MFVRRKVTLSIACVLLGALIIAVLQPWEATQGADPSADFVAALPSVEAARANEVVAVVNGAPIRRLQVEGIAVGPADAAGNRRDPKHVLQELIDTELLFQEALRRGISCSDAEVAEAIKMTREAVPDWAMKATLEYARRGGHEWTDDEYWASDQVRDHMRRGITIGKLRSTARAESRNSTRAETDLIARLRAGASIKIEDVSLR